MISKTMRIYGEWAESSIEVMKAFLKKGDTVVDIGANIGTVSIALADAVGESGKVYAFECQRKVFYNLCTNIMLNSCYNIFAIRALIGDTKGVLALDDEPSHLKSSSSINRGSMSFVGFAEHMKIDNQVGIGFDKVSVNTLDEEIASLDSVKLIKIDVEGAEPAVLRGAVRTLKRNRPIIYLECGSEKLFRDVMPRLESAGYNCYWHAALHYRSDNYFNMPNMTGRKGDLNILALPPNVLVGSDLIEKYNLKKCIGWSQVNEEFPGFQF